MFDAFISCQVFGLPKRDIGTCLDIAKSWSGNADLEPSNIYGAIYWDDNTRYEEQAHIWRQAPPPSVIRVRNALLPLGDVGEVSLFAYAAPLPGLPAAFKNAARTYVSQRDRTGSLSDVQVDLTSFYLERARELNGSIHSVSGTLVDGTYIVVSPRHSRRLKVPLRNLDAIEFSDKGKITRVNNDLDFQVSDVSSEVAEVVESLVHTFGMLQRYVRLGSSQEAPEPR